MTESQLIGGIVAGGAIYLLTLSGAFIEAGRRKNRERDKSTETGGLACAIAYWISVVIHVLAGLGALTLLPDAGRTGPIGLLGTLFTLAAPTTGFFVAISRPNLPKRTAAIHFLWRAGVFVGIGAVMIGIGSSACAIQSLNLK